ncbi:hypothetical protein GBAR_LOCUS14917, partial [Geodia barretti]
HLFLFKIKLPTAPSKVASILKTLVNPRSGVSRFTGRTLLITEDKLQHNWHG